MRDNTHFCKIRQKRKIQSDRGFGWPPAWTGRFPPTGRRYLAFRTQPIPFICELTMHINSDRIFQGESTFPGHEEWFYRAREGVAGPYLNRDDAALALRRFIKYCQNNRLDGGREMPAAAGGSPGIGVGLAKALARIAPRALSVWIAAAWAPGRQRTAKDAPPSRNPPGRLSKRGFKKHF